MPDGYEVDPAALDGLIQILDDAASYVRDANAELGGSAGMGDPDSIGEVIDAAREAEDERTDLLGNDSLAGAAADFADKWRYGLDKLDEAAQEVIGRLQETRQTYDAAEDDGVNVFSSISDTLNGGGSW
jgi:hypothetical protein